MYACLYTHTYMCMYTYAYTYSMYYMQIDIYICAISIAQPKQEIQSIRYEHLDRKDRNSALRRRVGIILLTQSYISSHTFSNMHSTSSV